MENKLETVTISRKSYDILKQKERELDYTLNNDFISINGCGVSGKLYELDVLKPKFRDCTDKENQFVESVKRIDELNRNIGGLQIKLSKCKTQLFDLSQMSILKFIKWKKNY